MIIDLSFFSNCKKLEFLSRYRSLDGDTGELRGPCTKKETKIQIILWKRVTIFRLLPSMFKAFSTME